MQEIPRILERLAVTWTPVKTRLGKVKTKRSKNNNKKEISE